nr:hypothetical protein [Lachnospiraceae bacterium]
EKITDEDTLKKMIQYQQMTKYPGIYNYVVENLKYVVDIDGYFFYDGYYNATISGDNFKSEMIDLLFYTLLILLGVGGIFSYEHENGAKDILASTYKGRLSLQNAKRRYAYILSFICFLFINLKKFIYLSNNDCFSVCKAQLNNLKAYSWIKWDITISQYLIIMYIIKFLGYLAITNIVLIIASKSKKTVTSIIVCFTVLIVPILSSVVITEKMKYFTLVQLLSINENVKNIFNLNSTEHLIYSIGTSGAVISLSLITFIVYTVKATKNFIKKG